MSLTGFPPTVRRFAEEASSCTHSVLLTGETGVGKTRLARAIHDRTVAKEFVEVNCAALAPSLIESQLFGHSEGSFSGATRDQVGLLQSADGGTLFLDEIGDLPVDLQAKLLRFLDTGRYRRIGQTVERSSVVRLITATNRSAEFLDEGRGLRRDLYYRIAILHCHLPPLRERKRSMHLIAAEILRELGLDAHEPRLTGAALVHLKSHDWPGNLRELRNVLLRALLKCASQTEIGPECLPSFRGDRTPGSIPSMLSERYERAGSAQEERDAIVAALKRYGGNRARSAKALGMSRTTLWARIREYGLDT